MHTLKETLNKSHIVIASVLAFSREAAGCGGKQSRIYKISSGYGLPRRFTPRKDILVQRFLKSLAVVIAFGCYVPFVLAADASVNISSPAAGAKLSRTAQTKVNYEVTPGSKGDHTHLYVDDQEAAVLRQLKGSQTLESLAPGKHEICIKVVNRNHTPIGVQQCIKVSVE